MAAKQAQTLNQLTVGIFLCHIDMNKRPSCLSRHVLEKNKQLLLYFLFSFLIQLCLFIYFDCIKLPKVAVKDLSDRFVSQTFPVNPHNTFKSIGAVQLPPQPPDPSHQQVVIRLQLSVLRPHVQFYVLCL